MNGPSAEPWRKSAPEPDSESEVARRKTALPEARSRLTMFPAGVSFAAKNRGAGVQKQANGRLP